MSFAENVKDELIKLCVQDGAMKLCCKHAQAYGLFLFCRDFSSSSVSINTENQSVARFYADTVKELTGKSAKVSESAAGKYKVTVKTADDRKKLLSAFSHTGTEITRRLNRANLDDDCCVPALLRGAFLACGTMTDPSKDYHLEFVVSHKVLCNDIIKLLNEAEMYPKYVGRKGSHVVYFKDSESVEDLLTFMGATESSLEIMGTKMFKDMRNRVNRRMNFENANSSRAFDAAYRQLMAIRYIEDKKGLAYLPDDLRELARLRLENEDYTLKDLAENLHDPISKSGVNHRLARILQIYEELKAAEKKV